MSDAPGEKPASTGDLQFDQVEYTSPEAGAPCVACGRSLESIYYDVNGQTLCPDCRDALAQSMAAGTPLGRFARATFYGSLAGLVGAAIYYGVREATNIEFGLIAILVGFMIGKAVSKGSNGRGGWVYQCLAIFLTYTAIVLTLIPPLFQAIGQAAEKHATEKQAAAEQPIAANGDNEKPTLIGVVAALALLVGFAFALPIILGFQSPMGLIILGIGLYQAWLMNRRVKLEISGPHAIQRPPAEGDIHVRAVP